MKSRKVAGPLKDLYRQSACQANQIAAGIYTAANTQKSKELRLLLEGGDYSSIVSASVDPTDYVRGSSPNVDTFKRDYLCVELMSKFPNWELGIDRAAVALKKFSEVEEHLTHLKFMSNPRVVVGQSSTTMHAVIMTARRKIEKMLGELDVNEVYSFFAFGPGASTSQSRRRSDAAFKFGAPRPHLTYNAVPLADALSHMHPTWRFTAEVVSGSRLVTVPKNAKTDRTICIEPDLNMYFQKGLGKVIRRRLQRWGLLKPDAQQYNAELAREGSAYGRLATVDLSSASDSIHMGLVTQLLPPLWVDLIELMRSPMAVLPDGELKLLRKVSSMGNGFTFELETLIFYGLCSAVIELLASKDMDHRCTVFGDDIIVDRGLVAPLEEVLHYLGFEMNRKKTFSDGYFRESCGKHYFAGIDVTPFYIRLPVDTVSRKYWAANTVRRYSRMPWGLDSTYLPVYNGIISSIPDFFRENFLIPEGVGDIGLMVDWDEARPSRKSNGLDAWSFTGLLPRNRRKSLEGQGLLLKCLHSLELSRSGPDVETDLVSQKIGVLDAYVDWLKVDSVRTMNPLREDIELLAQVICQRDGLGEVERTSVPEPQGFRIKKGMLSQRWPSFGPWM